MRKSCLIIGAAYSIGGAHIGNRRAPFFFRYHAKLPIQWHKIYWQDSTTLQSYPNLLSSIKRTNRQLIHKICQIRSHFKPIILGGDHSCAIATWQAVSSNHLDYYGLMPILIAISLKHLLVIVFMECLWLSYLIRGHLAFMNEIIRYYTSNIP